ncbi:aldo/keto reductase [Streptomyces albidus (ex Kaewkla and Franco 2022)]|uniref:aldo/keto reductase n=1 Tax=Streptomyces albidus (ex Kaewkla and Franco 2022) TaxID=722709 RepID=UPI0015EE3AE3|nr:aldo/keto reductase [Streptomyces albidus (ex Kaewkla and Franco 2022)]
MTGTPEKAATWTGRTRVGARGPGTSALGMGTWAIGGPWTSNGRAAGWGDVDDDVSVRTVHASAEAGVRLFDTADCYGAGHSERVLGRALKALPQSVRSDITVATKFGNVFDEASRAGGGTDLTPAGIRRACAASLRRLGVEAIDVYQLHPGVTEPAEAEEVVAVLEELADEGKVRWYGTSCDDPEVVRLFGRAPRAVSVQTQLNVFGGTGRVLDEARTGGLGVLARTPLAMGLLGGRYGTTHRPAPGDVRLDTPYWDYFDEATMPAWLDRLTAVRELLTSDGRTLAQGSLCYLWGLSPEIIPIPGARTPQQAEENAKALAHGPLEESVVAEIDALLADSPERR